MSQASYAIERTAAGWTISHDGETSPPYDTVESAFEAACTAASLAIREGHRVSVTVAPSTAPATEGPPGEQMVRLDRGTAA